MTDSLFIRVNKPHIIDFTTGTTDYYETNPAKPLTLAVEITDDDGDEEGLFVYSWDFDNDGTEDSDLENPLISLEHALITDQETDYIIQLTVTDQNNLSVTDTVIVKVVNTYAGTLFTDEYWSGTHILSGQITIPLGITLTIAPNTDVQVTYNPAYGYNYGILVLGTLNAETGSNFGIPDNVLEKWKGVDIEGEANLFNIKIEDAVRGITVVHGSSAVINSCILNNNIAGIHVLTTDQIIHATEFSNNIYGVKEEKGTSARLETCIFTNNIFDYYHSTLTRLTMEELNSLPGCQGNTNGGGE